MSIMRTQRPILRHPLLWGALLLAAAPGLTPARTAPAPAAKAPSDVGAQAGLTKYLADGRSTAMSGGVQFTQDDAVLKTDHAIALQDKDDNLLSADAPGPVHLYDPQDDLTGLHGSIDFPRHLARLEGSVVLHVIPGKREANAPTGSPRRQFKDPATLTCTLMTYDYRRHVGKIPGPLTVTQIIQKKDGPVTRTLTADSGLYSGRAQTILLAGTVKGEDSDGSMVTNADTRPSGKPIVIGIKEGAEYVTVPFRTVGKFKVKPQADDGKDGGDGLDELPPPPAAPTPGASPDTATNTMTNTVTNIAPPPVAAKPGDVPPASAPVGTAPPAPAGTGKL